jgi:hypothetical protein
MLKRLTAFGLFAALAAVGPLYLVGPPNLASPEFGFAFLIAVACATHWLLKKVPGQYESPRCPNCGRYIRS